MALACSWPRTNAEDAKREQLLASLRIEHEQRLKAFLRDSLVIDSIARTIPVDSLRSLYVHYLSDPDPLPSFQAMVCVRTGLARKYGAAAEYAETWLRDSLFQRDPRAAARAERRLPATAIVSTDGCPRTELGPTFVNGTNIRFTPVRPRSALPE